MNSPVIKINNLDKVIDKTKVLDGVNVDINKGDVIALLGENGAGKTTLIETILGFGFPSNGYVELFSGTAKPGFNDTTKQLIGYVPQSDDLLEFMSVKSYLDSVGSFYTHWNSEFVDSLLDQWNLEPSKIISKLSIGQKQMVSIIAAIGHEPSLLILDEPVSSLDPSSRRKFLKTLIELQLDRDVTMVFSTHIVSDVERLANRLWILKAGRLVLDNSIDELKEQSDQALEDLFLEVNQ